MDSTHRAGAHVRACPRLRCVARAHAHGRVRVRTCARTRARPREAAPGVAPDSGDQLRARIRAGHAHATRARPGVVNRVAAGCNTYPADDFRGSAGRGPRPVRARVTRGCAGRREPGGAPKGTRRGFGRSRFRHARASACRARHAEKTVTFVLRLSGFQDPDSSISSRGCRRRRTSEASRASEASEVSTRPSSGPSGAGRSRSGGRADTRVRLRLTAHRPGEVCLSPVKAFAVLDAAHGAARAQLDHAPVRQGYPGSPGVPVLPFLQVGRERRHAGHDAPTERQGVVTRVTGVTPSLDAVARSPIVFVMPSLPVRRGLGLPRWICRRAGRLGTREARWTVRCRRVPLPRAGATKALGVSRPRGGHRKREPVPFLLRHGAYRLAGRRVRDPRAREAQRAPVREKATPRASSTWRRPTHLESRNAPPGRVAGARYAFTAPGWGRPAAPPTCCPASTPGSARRAE